MSSEIIVSKNIEELSEHFAQILLYGINNSKDFFNLALSGGSTPKAVFNFLAENYQTKIDWNKIRFYWGDERCVPPNHPDSNYLITHEHLFSKIGISEKNIFRIYGENEPQLEAQRYSDVIFKNVPLVNNIPSFNLIMLGLGEDGHTASIFPERLELFQSNYICSVAAHPLTQQQRITLTGKVINNSKKIVFLVMGKSKSNVADIILNKKEGFEKLPAALVNSIKGELIWLLDKEAGINLLNSKKT